jgi:hypothetical protein
MAGKLFYDLESRSGLFTSSRFQAATRQHKLGKSQDQMIAWLESKALTL